METISQALALGGIANSKRGIEDQGSRRARRRSAARPNRRRQLSRTRRSKGCAMTPDELLSKHGITLESYEPGQHSTTCPECSHKRVKKTLKCLGVKIGDDGKSVCWNCGHCGWSGPKKGSGGNRGNG